MFMFDFPPPQVMEVAKQNQIVHVRYDKMWTLTRLYNYKIYIGKYKTTKQEECIMFDGKEAHKCDLMEHNHIFTIYR